MPVTDRDVVEVPITRDMARQARAYAEKALTNPAMRAASIRRGMPSEDSLDTKLAWRQGELALHSWCKERGLRSELPGEPASDTDEYDLLVEGVRIEVKTKNTRFRPKLDGAPSSRSWYLLVPEDQRAAHVRKGVARYVCAATWRGHGVVLLIGWCDDAFFRSRGRIAEPGERLPGGWTMPSPRSYWIPANELMPMAQF